MYNNKLFHMMDPGVYSIDIKPLSDEKCSYRQGLVGMHVQISNPCLYIFRIPMRTKLS